MGNTYAPDYEIQGGGYMPGLGGGLGGGVIGIVLVFIVVLWLLMKDGHGFGHDNHGSGGGYGGYGGFGCGPCVQPAFKDESNWEEESHLKDKMCCIDKDVIEQGCKDREAIHCDGDKTREYIAHLSERADDKAYNQLAMQNMQKDNFIQTLQLKSDFEGKLDRVLGVMEKGFCRTDGMIGKLECEIPHRPPFYACGGEPTVYPYPERNERYGQFDGYDRRDCCC